MLVSQWALGICLLLIPPDFPVMGLSCFVLCLMWIPGAHIWVLMLIPQTLAQKNHLLSVFLGFSALSIIEFSDN